MTKIYKVLLMICISMKGIKFCLLNLSLLISQHNNTLIILLRFLFQSLKLILKKVSRIELKKGGSNNIKSLEDVDLATLKGISLDIFPQLPNETNIVVSTTMPLALLVP